MSRAKHNDWYVVWTGGESTIQIAARGLSHAALTFLSDMHISPHEVHIVDAVGSLHIHHGEHTYEVRRAGEEVAE